jgi:hypothetical protein
VELCGGHHLNHGHLQWALKPQKTPLKKSGNGAHGGARAKQPRGRCTNITNKQLDFEYNLTGSYRILQGQYLVAQFVASASFTF